MALEMPYDLAGVARSQLEAWKAELDALRHDPMVKRFLELRDNISVTDDSAGGHEPEQRPDRSWPFGVYDAFEVARDLAGRDVSTFTLTKVLDGRFPDMSGHGRQTLMDFLVDNGRAEVIRKSVSGRPTGYRFAGAQTRSTLLEPADTGVPSSELSRFKIEDLEDIVWLTSELPR